MVSWVAIIGVRPEIPRSRLPLMTCHPQRRYRPSVAVRGEAAVSGGVASGSGPVPVRALSAVTIVSAFGLTLVTPPVLIRIAAVY
jgi:hypothetical protein